MAKINTEVDFVDENDVKGESNNSFLDNIKGNTDAEKEHTILDIIHKLFVISAFHNHRKQMNEKSKPVVSKKRIKGALS